MTTTAGKVEIRPEQPGDEPAIRHVNDEAFGEPEESGIVDAVRAAKRSVISLVAVLGGEIVGHILFTPVTRDPGAQESRILALGPMAVLPDLQQKGIGSKLVEAGLRECAQRGYGAVIVIGHPTYYPRFGFRPGSEYHLRSNFDVPDEVFMVAELEPGALDRVTGLVRYTPEFEQTKA